ncbi:MAG TPA: hypothetical protein VMU25_00125 [Candidatus Paceibacterota bacterium]|nr:hypothetical protein [Candidatus Paceibacterota bacterium]
MESFGKKAKNAIRAAVLGSSVVAGAAATESALDLNKAEAQTITQQSHGNNSPNVVSGGDVFIQGSGTEGHPNVHLNNAGSIQQKSQFDNSPNVISNGDIVIIDGKVYRRNK